MMELALVVPEPRLRADLLRVVRGAGFRADVLDSDPETLARSNANVFLIDVTSPAELATIEAVRAASPSRVIIALGADPGAALATRARRAGAIEFLRKPFGIEALERTLASATDRSAGRPEGEFLTADPRMQRLLDEIDRAATTEATIRISGESGTGKDLLAQRIHLRSPRHAGPFVVMGCAGLTERLAESDLFGHVPGAFTGAIDSRIGYLDAASGGTLVLDEVNELALGLQAKLLRALQEQEITPLGTSAPETIDLRLIATSQKDLGDEVEAGRFREDLYFRLDVIEFQIPPLRERPIDIPLLAQALLERFAHHQGSEPPRLREEDKTRLTQHLFRGNVRELQNMMRRATILFAGREIDLDGLLSRRVADAIPQATIDTFNLRELEKETIHRALEARGGNRTQAARALGISVRTLRNKIRAYELGDPTPHDRAIRAGYVST